MNRPDLSREWLTSPDGLNVPAESIYSWPDPYVYQYRFFASSQVEGGMENYKERVNIPEDLDSPEMQQYRIIECVASKVSVAFG